MAQPHQHGADDRSEREGTKKGRRLGRVLIPLGILLVILGIFAYILVVSLAATDDEGEVLENEGAATSVVIEVPVPALR